MSRELRTMEEKMKLDPNEIMENGLTRQQNEEAQKSATGFSMILILISLGLTFYSMLLLF